MGTRVRAACVGPLLLAALAGESVAQLPSPAVARRPLTSPANFGLTFGLEAISGTFSPGGSLPYEFDTRGSGVSLNVGLVWLRHVLFGLEGGTVFFRGDEEFSMSGVPYRAQTTNALVGSFYTGITTLPMGPSPRLGRKWWAGALLGSSKWTGARRMPDCVHCYRLKIPMESGLFVEPFVMFGGGDREGGGGIRAAYRRYLGGRRTIDGALHLGLFFNFTRL